MPSTRAIHLLLALLLLPGTRTAAAQRWAAVDVGSGHTCALDSGGRAFCWGINHHGELGAPTPPTCAPGHHGEGTRCWPSASPVPLAVQGGMRFRTLSVGGTRGCGMDGDGRAWCWGEGIGTARAGCAGGVVCSFTPVRFSPEHTFRTLRVGEDAVCGVTMDGAGRCWRPVRGADGRWSGLVVAPGERLAWVDHYGDWMSRDEHVVCAVTEDGRALCQGMNDYAQLGAGDTIPHPGAVRVASDARFLRVHPWSGSACGLTVHDRVLCWGVARSRPSWPGGTPPEPYMFACRYSGWCSGPRAIAPGLRFTALTVIRDRFCGLDTSGRAHCLGMDDIPVRVAAGVRFSTLEGSETHACGLTREGAIWCWEQGSGAPPDPPIRAADPPG